MIISNPLDQFVVRPIFGNFTLGINTFTLDTLLVSCVTFWIFYLLILANKNLSHLYTFAIGPALDTLSYGAVVGSKRYRPLYVFVFVLIAMSNLMGMIPFSLTSTSFAVMTFFAGMTMFVGINIVALASYNWKFVNLFLPSGAPLAIAPFLIIIETISYFARVMSLSIRLFANLLAGHALMKIIGGFV
jgi:F-type H+-transporting ATPase subunit a